MSGVCVYVYVWCSVCLVYVWCMYVCVCLLKRLPLTMTTHTLVSYPYPGVWQVSCIFYLAGSDRALMSICVGIL